MKKIYVLCCVVISLMCASLLSSEADLTKKSVQTLTTDEIAKQISSRNYSNLLTYNETYYQYNDNDVVDIVVELNGSSILDMYLSRNLSLSIAEYASSMEALNIKEDMIQEQNMFIDTLNQKGIAVLKNTNYSTLLNGVSLKTQYKNIELIKKESKVSNVIISETYEMPETSIYYSDDLYVSDTGIYDTSSLDYQGEGMLVAVLDSGYQLGHTVFETELNETKLSKNDIASLFGSTVASLDGNYTVDNFYYNSKVPFKYDYADSNSDVRSYTSDHGQHVAGIVAGDDEVITGAAPNAQLALMKVFSDGYGAATSDILAALEDSLLLGVDVVNMSLGSVAGFSSQHDDDYVNELYEKMHEAGISMVVSAGNNYSSGLWGGNGNTTSTDNPDSGLVGSPGSYAGNTTVASADTISTSYILGNDIKITAYDFTNNSSEYYDFLTMSGATSEIKEYEYVAIPNAGEEADYEGLNVEGKFALVSRGTTNFSSKVEVAISKGAAGVIIYNNDAGVIYASVGDNLTVPGFSITQEAGLALAATGTGVIQISTKFKNTPLMSEFSSWGPLPSLEFEPDITGPGGDIYSSVIDGYAYMSGTSMSAPNIAGITAVAKQYVKTKYPQLNSVEVANMTSQLMMSTAVILNDADGLPYSVRKQGAGLADIFALIETEVYLSVAGQTQTKIELFDDYERTGEFEFSFEVNNTGSSSQTYLLSSLLMTETASTTPNSIGNYVILEQAYMLSGDITYTVNGSNVTSVTVNGQGKTTVNVKIVLSKEDITYIEETFANGIFIEGFIELTNAEVNDLSIPFLGFYGDWTELDIFDSTVYDDEYADMYDSFIVGGLGGTDYNFILGQFLYDYDESLYGEIEFDGDKIVLGYEDGTINNIYAVFLGLLRGAESIEISIVDKVTGQVVYYEITENCRKSHLNTSYLQIFPFYGLFDFYPADYGLSNNGEYDIVINANLDYHRDAEAADTLTFSFTADYEAPTISSHEVYTNNGRTYIDVVVSDNQYAQAINPAIVVGGELVYLSNYATPVFNEKGQSTVATIDITNFMTDILASDNQSLVLLVDDYALNTNVYSFDLSQEQMPECEFNVDSLSVSPNQVLYLSSLITNYEMYSEYLTVTSSDACVVVDGGILIAASSGTATITVKNTYDNTTMTIEVTVLTVDDEGYEEIEVTEQLYTLYFETITSKSNIVYNSSIGNVGDMYAVSNYGTITMNLGEQVTLGALFTPSYLDVTVNLYLYYNDGTLTLSDGVITAVTGDSWDAVIVVANINGNEYTYFVYIDVTSEFYMTGTELSLYLGNSSVVTVPEGTTSIGTAAFAALDADFGYMDTNLTQVILPSSVTSISMFAFAGCDSLTSINLENVKSIGEFAFYYCPSLKTIGTLNASYYGDYAFALTVIDTTLSIPANANVSIGEGAFLGSTALGGLISVMPVVRGLIIGDGATVTIGASAFEGLSGSNCLTNISFGTGITLTIGDYAFKDCTYLANNNSTTLTFPSDSNITIGEFAFQSVNTRTGNGITGYNYRGTINIIFGENSTYNIGESAFENSTRIKTITFGENSSYTIGSKAFSSGEYSSINLSGSTFTIGRNAFRSGLSTLTISSNAVLVDCDIQVCSNTSLNVTNNSSNYVWENNMLYTADYTELVFMKSSAITDVTIDARVTSIADGKFAGITTLTSVTFGAGSQLESIGASAFEGCTALTSVTLNSNVVVGDYAFYGCTKLTTIDTTKLTGIGTAAFYNTALTEATINEGVVVGDYAFNNTKITTLTLNDNVVVGYASFANTSLEEVIFVGDATVVISQFSFANNGSLTTFDISRLNGYVPAAAFNNCTSLTITDTSSLELVGDYAFNGVNTTNLDLSNATYIGNYAFVGTTTISIKLNEEVQFIGTGAFLNASNLETITVNNTTTAEMNSYKLVDSVLYGKVSTGLTLMLYPINKTDSTYEVLEGTVLLEAYSMMGNTNLEEVTLPSSLLAIEDYALFGCTSLAKVNFNSYNAPVLRGEYSSTSSLYNQFVANIDSGVNLTMTRPSNGVGYDSTLFTTYFSLEIIGDLVMDNITLYIYNSLMNLGDVQLDDQELIIELRNLYDSIVDNDQLAFLADVISTLEEAEAKIVTLLLTQEVITLINMISDEVTLEDSDVIEAARTLLNTVTDKTELVLLANYIAELEAAELRISELEYAVTVRAAIEALSTIITLDDKALVEAARTLYNNVNNSNDITSLNDCLQTLLAAEAKIATLELTQEVITSIDSISEVITLSDKEAIEAARAKYDSVTDEAELALLADYLETLEEAEAALAALIKLNSNDEGGSSATVVLVASGTTLTGLAAAAGVFFKKRRS